MAGTATRVSGVISVPDAVCGGMMTATVNPGGTDVYVLVRYYTPDFDGEFVYVRYFPEDGDNSADIGLLSSRLWPDSGSSVLGRGGLLHRDGLGRWVVVAATTFFVSAFLIRVASEGPGAPRRALHLL